MPKLITELREKIGLKKKVMSDQLKISMAALYNYEHGKRFPRQDIAYRIIALAKLNGITLTLEDIYPIR